MDARASALSGRVLAIAAVITALAMVMTTLAVTGATPKTKLVSKNGGGSQIGSVEGGFQVNGSGHFVAFVTEENDNGSLDGNFERDVYLRKVNAGSTKIVSVSSSEKIGDDSSWDPAISGQGRFVAFASSAMNFSGQANGFAQVYLRDRKTGKTSLVSRNASGAGAGSSRDPDVSANGRFVVFVSDASLTSKPTGGRDQVYLRDLLGKKTILVSKSNAGKAGTDNSWDPQISADGRYVVYTSGADNLVPVNNKDSNQIYRYDRVKKKTSLISKNRYGKAGNDDSEDAEISGDGKVIVYESDASNLVSGDKNGMDDIFMRKGGKTKRVSLNYKGKQLWGGFDGAEDPDISRNGRWLSFESTARNATKAGNTTGYDHVYLRDLRTGKLTLVSRAGSRLGNAESGDARISGDGRFVVFRTRATNLHSPDSNGGGDDILRRGPYH